MKRILLLISMLVFANSAYTTDLTDLHEENPIRLEKINTLDQIQTIITQAEYCAMETDELRRITDTFRCDLYGTYVIKHQDNKIGIISLGDATGTYHESKAECLGFADGSWVEISIFLDPEHAGQGHYSRVNKK